VGHRKTGPCCRGVQGGSCGGSAHPGSIKKRKVGRHKRPEENLRALSTSNLGQARVGELGKVIEGRITYQMAKGEETSTSGEKRVGEEEQRGNWEI